MIPRKAVFLLLPLAALLAGCWDVKGPFIDNTPAVNAAPAVAAPAGLAGKWMLELPGAGSCLMDFGAQPDATEGSIAPARTCPYDFVASRKWSYVTGGLVIRNHKAQTLAQLSPVGPDRYEGRSSDGQEVALFRALP